MRTWYAVCDECCSYDEGDERDLAHVWTVSTDQKQTGWCTDSGCPGYGLTRADAEFLAHAANEAERFQAAITPVDYFVPPSETRGR